MREQHRERIKRNLITTDCPLSDLAPKVLLSRGSMVDLLVSSDIAKYADFRIVSRILTRQGEELKQVPCCRADVFNSKEVRTK